MQLFFDLDGVICYTDQYHYQAWKQMADEIQVYFDAITMAQILRIRNQIQRCS